MSQHTAITDCYLLCVLMFVHVKYTSQARVNCDGPRCSDDRLHGELDQIHYGFKGWTGFYSCLLSFVMNEWMTVWCKFWKKHAVIKEQSCPIFYVPFRLASFTVWWHTTYFSFWTSKVKSEMWLDKVDIVCSNCPLPIKTLALIRLQISLIALFILVWSKSSQTYSNALVLWLKCDVVHKHSICWVQMSVTMQCCIKLIVRVLSPPDNPDIVMGSPLAKALNTVGV